MVPLLVRELGSKPESTDMRIGLNPGYKPGFFVRWAGGRMTA